MIHHTVKWSVLLPLGAVAVVIGLWCFGAIYYKMPILPPGNMGLGFIFLGIYLGCWIFLPRYWRGAALVLLASVVMIWFAGIKPDPNTCYQTNWALMPAFTFDGDRITIHNIRDFHYRSEFDYDVRYRTETFDLSKAKSLSLAVSHWDGLQAIGHTMLAFEFFDGKYVTISVETRLPVGKEQSTLAGMFKQFGLIMIFGTDSDLIKLRATHRGETLYFYPTTATPEATRIAFERLCHRAEQLRLHPEFYNTLYSNCTTVLFPPLRPILLNLKFDWRMILNGTIDSFAAEKGYIDMPSQGEAYEEGRNRHRVRAGIPGEGLNYSRALRAPNY